MLPGGWQQLLRAIPLQYLTYFPAAIFLGKVTGDQLLGGLAIQFAWLVFFIVAARTTFHLGVRRYSGFGG